MIWKLIGITRNDCDHKWKKLFLWLTIGMINDHDDYDQQDQWLWWSMIMMINDHDDYLS